MSDDINRRECATAEDVVAKIPSGARIFVHGAAMTPTELLSALSQRGDLDGVTLYHLHTDGSWPFETDDQLERFRSVALFAGPHHRKLIAQGQADFMPIFLADIPNFLKAAQLNVALLQLSPPDAHGFCTLGTSVDAAMKAAETADIVLAQINPRVPRTLGRSAVHISRVDAFVRVDRPLYTHQPTPETEVTAHIGELIAELVEDGSTLQTGIGAIPDAVLRRLGDKNDLGVHTEMFSDGVIDLFEAGVINNSRKKVHRGRIVTSFIAGTQRLYDFAHDNPLVEFHPCDRTNDTALIRKNPKVVAINSAIEIDLSGQVCADSMGHRIYSGIGGQMDFIRGAAISEGGKPIIALPATAARGTVSRICAELKPGAGVVTTRGHVHWVVTEYGAVNLHGLSLKRRGEALISIAHPDFRPELRKTFAEQRHFLLTSLRSASSVTMRAHRS